MESLDLLAENESLKKQNEELHQLLANQQSDYAELSNQLSNQNEKLVDAKEATETRFETLFNNLQQRKVLSEIANKTYFRGIVSQNPIFSVFAPEAMIDSPKMRFHRKNDLTGSKTHF